MGKGTASSRSGSANPWETPVRTAGLQPQRSVSASLRRPAIEFGQPRAARRQCVAARSALALGAVECPFSADRYPRHPSCDPTSPPDFFAARVQARRVALQSPNSKDMTTISPRSRRSIRALDTPLRVLANRSNRHPPVIVSAVSRTMHEVRTRCRAADQQLSSRLRARSPDGVFVGACRKNDQGIIRETGRKVCHGVHRMHA